MNIKFIERTAGPDIAQIIDNGQDLELGEPKEIDGKELDELIRGAVVLGAQPIDYPNTDGEIIYLKGRNGNISITIEPKPDKDGFINTEIAIKKVNLDEV